MSKKVLSILLACCMALTMLPVTAFAVNPNDYCYSSEAGSFNEITALEFSVDELVIPNGEAEYMGDYLTAYCGDEKISMDVDGLEWNITESLAFGLEWDSPWVTNVGEDEGEATVTVKVPETEISAAIKLVADENPWNEPVPATGFKFSQSKYIGYDNIVSGEDYAVRLEIQPTNDYANFTPDQIHAIRAALFAALNEVGMDGNPVPLVGADYPGSIFFEVYAAETNGVQQVELKDVLLPCYTEDGDPVTNDKGEQTYYAPVDYTIEIDIKEAKPALKVVCAKSVTIEVGQTANLNECLAYTTGATYGKEVVWNLNYYNDTAISYGYAVLENDWSEKFDEEAMLLGVAVGKLKAEATLISDPSVTTTVPIEVVARGALSGGETPSAPTAVTLSGTITSTGSGRTAVELLDANGSVVASTTTTDGSYSIANVAAGTYTLKASKSKHAAREYTITIDGADVVQDVALHLLGDVNGDGAVNTRDALQINRCSAKKSSVFDTQDADADYRKIIGNVNGDGAVNTRDALQINRSSAKKSSVFDTLA